MKDSIKKAGILATKYTHTAYKEGRIPLALGVHGMMALMYDRIANYMSGNTGLDKEELASLALSILAISLPTQKSESISHNSLDTSRSSPPSNIRDETGPPDISIQEYDKPDVDLIKDLEQSLDDLDTMPGIE